MGESESPLQRLRRIEAEEQGRREPSSAGSSQTGTPTAKRGGVVAILIAVAFLLLTKGKLILFFVLTKGKLLLGALKLGPLLTTLGTMGAMIWLYASFYGVSLAIGFVLLILVHELGHGLAARFMNLKVGAPIFIPFFGAVIMLKDQPRSTWVEAVIGFGGPLAGLLGGVAVLIAGFLMKSEYWGNLCIVLAWLTFLINFFNLMPVFGLDGDRISQPFAAWYWVPGCLFLAGLAWACLEYTGRIDPFIVIILILGAVKGGRLWWRRTQMKRGTATPERLVDRVTGRAESLRYPDEADVLPWQRRTAGWAFFLLAGVLCTLMIIAWRNLPNLNS